MTDSLGYYAILEVDADADAGLIKNQYRDLAKIWHPDSNKSEDAMEHFQKLSVAYDVLKNEDSRLVYDLLSEIYTPEDFPDMDNLSILKDKYNRENPLVRVVTLYKVMGKITKYTFTEDKLVCTYDQAKQEVLRYSLINWFCGWWHPKAFVKNIKAIKANIHNIGHNDHDNLTLLIHNAIAFREEKKNKQALISALGALEFADYRQAELLNRYIAAINEPHPAKLPQWRMMPLKALQFVIPFLLLLAACYPFIRQYNFNRYMKKQETITYFQKVNLNSGGEIMDDVVVSKIVSIPVNITDNGKLVHLTEETPIMYGPDKKFDVKAKGKVGQTLRITGYTPDKTWWRIMMDNGEMGFVPAKMLQKGIGTPPPFGSKIVPGAL